MGAELLNILTQFESFTDDNSPACHLLS